MINDSKWVSKVHPANIQWLDSGQPYSVDFGDVYFSKHSGLEETVHTFVESNQLYSRFMTLKDKESFTIAETGFGTGLNFLCVWQIFDCYASKNTNLHFISVEKHPLDLRDMKKSWQLWPQLAIFIKELEKIRLHDYKTVYHFVFHGGRVRLTLFIGDASERLRQLSGCVDAWFLDGFSPAKNPEMWTKELFQIMAEKSHCQTTYSTFTAARLVRDGLLNAGFSVNKRSGFASKREMIFGNCLIPLRNQTEANQWMYPVLTHKKLRSVVVIGGGLAGVCTARSLAEKGWRVVICERHSKLAQEASGNSQGILYAKISAYNTLLTQFILQGYLHSVHRFNQLKLIDPLCWHPSGVLQLAHSDKERKRQKLLVEHYPNSILYQNDKGIFFPNSGWANPVLICQLMSNHPNITINYNCDVKQLKRDNHQWSLLNESSDILMHSEYVVFAGGVEGNKLDYYQHFPLKSIRGQVSYIQATQASSMLKHTLCGDGYITPAFKGVHSVGATFDFSNELCVLKKDHEKNLANLARQCPEMFSNIGGLSADVLGGRVGFRCTTPDYLPIVGAVVNKDSLMMKFAKLRKNSKLIINATPDYMQGLYINTGHGSRGLVTCPLSGEILASLMTGSISPVDKLLLKGLHPNRFLVKKLIRG